MRQLITTRDGHGCFDDDDFDDDCNISRLRINDSQYNFLKGSIQCIHKGMPVVVTDFVNFIVFVVIIIVCFCFVCFFNYLQQHGIMWPLQVFVLHSSF